MSRRGAALALLGFVALGLPDGMLGPAWPAIRQQLHQPLAALGEIAAMIGVGAVCAGLLAGRVRARVGPGRALAAGVTVGTAALALFAVTGVWVVLLVAAALAGGGGALFDAGFNAQVALHRGPRLMNALHASYGVGTTIGPLVIAAALAAGSWRIGWIVAAASWLAIAIAVWRLQAGFAAELPERWSGVARPARRLGLPLVLALFFLAVGVEAAVGAWGATLLEHRGWRASLAAAWIASYWAAFTLGRAALAAIGDRLRPEAVLRGSGGILLGGLALLSVSPFGLPLAGLGIAGFFPALTVLTPFRLGPERVGAAAGYQLAAGTAGGAAVVAAAGVAAQWLGVGAVPLFLLGATALLIALELLAARTASSSTGPRRAP